MNEPNNRFAVGNFDHPSSQGFSFRVHAENRDSRLHAFRYGPPPHAGFAFGMDRLTAVLAGEENIREVIAYPKTQSGADPLTGAPTPIDDRQLEELGLQVLPPAS